MTQVETRDTVDVGEALDRIRNSPHAIRIGTPNGVGFIRDDPENDSEAGDYKVNLPLPYIGVRTVVEVDGGAVTEAIKDAETAQIVPMESTPWSGNWNDEGEA